MRKLQEQLAAKEAALVQLDGLAKKAQSVAQQAMQAGASAGQVGRVSQLSPQPQTPCPVIAVANVPVMNKSHVGCPDPDVVHVRACLGHRLGLIRNASESSCCLD